MTGEGRIDGIARGLAGRLPRRPLIGGAAAALLGLRHGPRPAAAACQELGRPCETNGECCRGARCRGGECRCKQGWTDCDGSGACVRLARDEANCGRCGRRCLAIHTCCGGGCVDLDRQRDHCGACGVRCGADEFCDDGVCRPLA